MCCVVVSYLTNRISATNVRVRAGSSIRGSGGTLHQAVEIIVHPLYDDYTVDFDVALIRVRDNVCAKVHLKNQFKLCSNTINERGTLVYNLKYCS